MAKGDFGGKRNTAGFDKNPQNIDTSGASRKSFASVNRELMDKGVERLTKNELIKAYELVFNTDEEELKKIAEDEKTPYGLKLIIKELNNSKSRSKALADYRDYMFGRAKENVTIENVTISPEDRQKRIDELKSKLNQE